MGPEELTDPFKNSILAALTMNISATPENEETQKNVEYATKALFHALPYATQNF